MQIDISKKYLEFFIRNVDSRAILIQGSRRSSKSFSVYKYLNLMSSGNEPLTNYVVCASYPALTYALDDFQKATGLVVQSSQTIGFHATLRNGSRFIFKAYDDYTKAQGTSCDYVFFEESLNIDPRIVRVMSLGVRKQMIFAFNPTRHNEYSDYILPDRSNFLHTTFRDNKWLTPEQLEFFDMLKRKAEEPNATLYDIFAYKCYYLGEEADMVGRVFEKLEYCGYQDYLDVPAEECVAMDAAFGGSDRTAIVGCKLFENKLYVHTYYYGRGTLKAEELAITLWECGFNYATPILCDYGGVARMIYDEVISASNGQWTDYRISKGFSLCNAIKKPVLEGITAMMGLDAIVLDNSSDSTRTEFENLQLTEDKKLKGSDHACDAVRYAFTWLKTMGY